MSSSADTVLWWYTSSKNIITMLKTRRKPTNMESTLIQPKSNVETRLQTLTHDYISTCMQIQCVLLNATYIQRWFVFVAYIKVIVQRFKQKTVPFFTKVWTDIPFFATLLIGTFHCFHNFVACFCCPKGYPLLEKTVSQIRVRTLLWDF